MPIFIYMEIYDEEDYLTKTGTHKRRLAKITMYLDVPSLYEDNQGSVKFHSEESICRYIEQNLPKDVHTTSWSDIIISPIEGDNPKDFENPVGYIAPDGRFFLIESDENGLAHIHLSYRVYQLYSDLVNGVYGTSLENKLENSGFIKVHSMEIRYYSRMQYSGFYNQEKEFSPRINEAQQESIIRYLEYIMEKKFPGYKYVSINGHLVERSKIKQADNIQFNKYFTNE